MARSAASADRPLYPPLPACCCAAANWRFVPVADILRRKKSKAFRQNRSLGQLFDHLVGAAEQRDRHGDAERLGGLEIDNQLDLGG
jgi:hypothetical protein